jgi:magnesium chelatase accessory protein
MARPLPMAAERRLAPTADGLCWDRDGAAWPNREHSRHCLIDGLRWHVQVAGQGPVLLLLHGTAASTHSFADLLPRLARSHTVVCPDLPGHGFTRAPRDYRYSMESMADSLARLLQHLGRTPIRTAGHSAGAAILCRMHLQGQLGTQVPVVAINGALQGFGGLAGHLFGPLARAVAGSRVLPSLVARRARDRRSVARLLRSTGSRLGEPYATLYRQLFQDPQHVAAVLRMMANWNLHELERALPRLRCPLCLLVGERDLAVRPAATERLARRLAAAGVDVRLRTLVGLGHLAHEEAPAAVIAAMSAALQRSDPSEDMLC